MTRRGDETEQKKNKRDIFHFLILHDIHLSTFPAHTATAEPLILLFITFRLYVVTIYMYMHARMNENLFYVIFICVEEILFSECETFEWEKDTWGAKEVRKKGFFRKEKSLPH